jgi:hypothetical protein
MMISNHETCTDTSTWDTCDTSPTDSSCYVTGEPYIISSRRFLPVELNSR